jgi:CRP-like cAMP-binding protein
MSSTPRSTASGSPAPSSARRNRPGDSPQGPAPDPRHNRLLASLPEADWLRWRPQLEPISMPLGQVLYEPGAMLTHAYFPTSAIVALMYMTESGASAEIAVVGKEGIVGVPLFMGGGSTPSRAVARNAGSGFRMPGPAVREEFLRSGPVARIFLRYTQALIVQMAQIAACNRHHTLDQQLCRWLLSSMDRTPGNQLAVTQEQIAHMLGVRREGVTEAALSLQRAGLISYRRGQITVLDRTGLEKQSCECHAVVKAEYDRLLPDSRVT